MTDVDVRMLSRMILAVGVRFLFHFDRDVHKLAMPYAPLGDDLLGKMIDLARPTAQQCDLHAARMVKMNLQSCNRQIMMVVMHVGKPLGEFPHSVIVDIDECGDAIAIVSRIAPRLPHSGARKVTNGFRPALITAQLHKAVQFCHEFIIKSHAYPLHWTFSPKSGRIFQAHR